MFIPQTEDQKKEMLNVIGAKSFDDLLAGLPPSLLRPAMNLPTSLSEMELTRHMDEVAAKDTLALSFLGAGAYEHFIPTSVWALTLRGEFATAYTPYQPEASQGTLQSIYEFQTLICELFGMDTANASMYEGASSAAEACLVAARHTSRPNILLPDSVHPHTRQVIETYLKFSGAKIVSLPTTGGVLSADTLKKHLDQNSAAVLIQNPNFFGCLEDVQVLSKMAHDAGALVIASSYPVALGMIVPPGEYDADIAVAEGQPLGLPLGYGGPYVGLFACKNELIRKMPGRIVGQTVDLDGKRAFVLTLQAREQHIRREKATSNICTNQALCALASTIHMSLLGKEGLRELANLNFQKAHYAANELKKHGINPVFQTPFFNEFVVRCAKPPKTFVEDLARKEHILAGLPLEDFYPNMQNDLLVCITEIKTKQDIDKFVAKLAEVSK
jgi:glycine dehydrogenase subunit 1